MKNERLAELIENLQGTLSIGNLSEVTGISTHTLRRWLQGKVNYVHKPEKLLEYIGCDRKTFLGYLSESVSLEELLKGTYKGESDRLTLPKIRIWIEAASNRELAELISLVANELRNRS